MLIDNPEFVMTVTKLADCLKSKSKKAKIEASILERALLAFISPVNVITKTINSEIVSTKLKDDDGEPLVITKEEIKQFEKEDSIGKNDKEKHDREWILQTIKNGWDNPANWSDSGMRITCAGHRSFGDNLYGFLKDNGLCFNELEISPSMAPGPKGETVSTWVITLTR